MDDFDLSRCTSVDWPILTVKRHDRMKTAMERQLDEFGQLDLSAQDEGFLRLARLILGSQPAPTDVDDGLIF